MKNILYLGVGGHKKLLKGWESGLFFSYGHFLAPGSGSAFTVRIRIQESQINPDPQEKFFVQEELVEMLKSGVVIPFHKLVCPACHNIPYAKVTSAYRCL
jgi:hypothetical protein